MHGVARLERDNFVPSALSDVIANFICSLERIGKIRLKVAKAQHVNWTGKCSMSKAGKGGDARVFRIECAEDLLGHLTDLCVGNLVDTGNVHDGKYGIAVNIGVS